MSWGRRGGVVALGIGLGLAITVVLVPAGTGQSGGSSAPGGAAPGSTSSGGIPGRVQRQVAGLKAESPEESLANLGDWELSYRPGGYFINEWDSGRLPLKNTDGAGTVKIILSNRRLLKVCEEMSALPPAQATELLNRYFPLWLQQYSEKYARYVENGRRYSPASVATGVPGNSYISGAGGGSDGDGLPNLECMRWRLLGLVLIAGNLRLQGTAPYVQKVAEEARAQRDYLYQAADELSPDFRALTLTMKSLYNRQILGYALVQANPVPERALAALAATGKGMTVKALPVYDAERTPYDRVLMPGPVDYSKGSLAVEYLEAVSDVDFENIFAAAVAR